VISPKLFPLLQLIAVKFAKKTGKWEKKNQKKMQEKLFHVDVLFTKYERETYGPERWQIKCRDGGVWERGCGIWPKWLASWPKGAAKLA